jgi:hypothetical protein
MPGPATGAHPAWLPATVPPALKALLLLRPAAALVQAAVDFKPALEGYLKGEEEHPLAAPAVQVHARLRLVSPYTTMPAAAVELNTQLEASAVTRKGWPVSSLPNPTGLHLSKPGASHHQPGGAAGCEADSAEGVAEPWQD